MDLMAITAPLVVEPSDNILSLERIESMIWAIPQPGIPGKP
jgi:hypothetical protein